MLVLKVLGIIYLAIGFVYGIFTLIWGDDPWYSFPINVLGGPIAIFYNIYITLKTGGRRLD